MSNISTLKTKQKTCLSIKAQTFSVLIAIVLAIVLPQFFHTLGLISGLGTIPSDIFLPMHLPIILAGFLVGPYAGAISGLFAPIISFLFSGMPNIIILPFMVIELSTYGSVAGFLKNIKLPTTIKLFITQVIGRITFLLSIIIAINLFSCENINVTNVLTSLRAGIFGIIIQLILIPLIMFRIEKRD